MDKLVKKLAQKFPRIASENRELPTVQPEKKPWKKPWKKPEALFLETHEQLRKAGEEWMKNTANSGVIVAVLVTTVVFAAAFTVPGGYDPNSGLPLFLHRDMFKLFLIFDALSLFFSTTSVVTFLSILTSRYAMDDFLFSLPNKLMIGLSTLLISMLTMMVSFVSALVIVFNHKLVWIAIPIAIVAGLPIIAFLWFQFGLLQDVVKSTYRNKSLFKPEKEPLFHAKGKEKTWWLSCFTKTKTG